MTIEHSFKTLTGTLPSHSGKSLSIFNHLEAAILEHKLKPGMKLGEDEVGEIYGASRTIVRGALQALAYSGLVVMERNRGAFVASPSIREAHEVFETRALIEPRIAQMASKTITNDQLDYLKEHIDEEHEAIASGHKGQAIALSGDFHLAIANIAKHGVMSQILRPLIARSSLIIALYWRRPDTTCESHSHDALIKAFSERNPEAAEEVMKSHIIDLHSGLHLVEKEEAATSLKDALL